MTEMSKGCGAFFLCQSACYLSLALVIDVREACDLNQPNQNTLTPSQ